MHLMYRTTCRVCRSPSLTKVIDLGEQYNQGAFVAPSGEMPTTRKVPLTLVRCDPTQDERACGLLQTSCSVPPSILYPEYWYRSGTNRTMRDHLQGIAEEAMDLAGGNGTSVLDIGANDGTLLGFFPSNYERYGIDPSNAVEDSNVDAVIVRDLFPSNELDVVRGGKRFEVITTIAMFYDLEDPVGFTRAVCDHLAEDGVWIFEMSYMPLMLAMNSYDTICHEHLEYYSLAVLEYILRAADMKLFNVTLNDINGGSIRCYATHARNTKFASERFQRELNLLRRKEFDLALDTDQPYRDFQRRVNHHRDELAQLVKNLKRAGKAIHVYGASTKGNTILQFCGLDHTVIDCAADRNPHKHGARTIGTDIPIVSEEESRVKRPDYYLVLPWHFKAEFLEREKEMLDGGVGMIFPLPEIEVVRRETS